MDRRGFLGVLGAAIAAPFLLTPTPGCIRHARFAADYLGFTFNAPGGPWDPAAIARAFKVPPHLVVTTETIEVQAMGQRCYIPGRTYVYEQWPDP